VGNAKDWGEGGGTNGCLKIIFFLKNQKHQPNIVEITHLCIMLGVHTSNIIKQHLQQAVPLNLQMNIAFGMDWTFYLLFAASS
jgi:hypothetical protein